MLDLKELERKLEEALSQETEESLTRWLLNKRFKELNYLGEGTFVELEFSNNVFHPLSHVYKLTFDTNKGDIPEDLNEYTMAA